MTGGIDKSLVVILRLHHSCLHPASNMCYLDCNSKHDCIYYFVS